MTNFNNPSDSHDSLEQALNRLGDHSRASAPASLEASILASVPGIATPISQASLTSHPLKLHRAEHRDQLSAHRAKLHIFTRLRTIGKIAAALAIVSLTVLALRTAPSTSSSLLTNRTSPTTSTFPAPDIDALLAGLAEADRGLPTDRIESLSSDLDRAELDLAIDPLNILDEPAASPSSM